MKALSIQQPWAWLIVSGQKDVENRGWPTSVRGEVLVHAGKKFDAEGWEFVLDAFPNVIAPPMCEFAKGGIVGSVEITGCVVESESPWFFGSYGFTLANAKQLPFRPLRGHLGFFDVPDGPTPPPAEDR